MNEWCVVAGWATCDLALFVSCAIAKSSCVWSAGHVKPLGVVGRIDGLVGMVGSRRKPACFFITFAHACACVRGVYMFVCCACTCLRRQVWSLQTAGPQNATWAVWTDHCDVSNTNSSYNASNPFPGYVRVCQRTVGPRGSTRAWLCYSVLHLKPAVTFVCVCVCVCVCVRACGGLVATAAGCSDSVFVLHAHNPSSPTRAPIHRTPPLTGRALPATYGSWKALLLLLLLQQPHTGLGRVLPRASPKHNTQRKTTPTAPVTVCLCTVGGESTTRSSSATRVTCGWWMPTD